MEKFPLNETLAPLSVDEWRKLNENWSRIKSYFNSVQSQLNTFLKGDVIDLLNRIDEALESAETSSQELARMIELVDRKITEATTAISNANTATSEANTATSQANTAKNNANTAATSANNAASRADTSANAANTAATNANAKLSEMSTLQDILEQLEDDLRELHDVASAAEDVRVANESTRVQAEDTRLTAETTRVTNETARIAAEETRNTSETTRVNAEDERVTNENTRVQAENARLAAEGTRVNNEAERVTNETARISEEGERVTNENTRIAAEQLRQALYDNLLVLFNEMESLDYVNTETYNFPNFVAYNGSTFIALKEVTGVTPTNDKVNWRLVAQRGVDGEGSVSSVNDMLPDETGNVTVALTEIVDGLVSDSTTAALSAKQGKVLKGFLDDHEDRTDNPHGVTKSQVGLGSVGNYGLATQAEAEAGTSSTKYMTPQRTKQAIDKNLTPLQTQVTEHLAHEEKHGIYTDTGNEPVYSGVKYKLVVINGEPFLEVVAI